MTRSLSMLFALVAFFTPAYAQEKKAQADFTSPEAVVKTMIAAIDARDADLLSKCFSSEAKGEFTALREKRVSESDWVEMKRMFDGALVGETFLRPDDPNRAVVSVQLKSRAERISVVKEGRGWGIVGF